MKFKLYLISICLTCLTAFTQNTSPKKYTKKISEPYKSDKNTSGLYNTLGGSGFVFSKGKEILSYNIKEGVIMIKKIDSEKLTVIKQNKYEKFFAKNYYPVDCIELNNRYFVFYSSWDGESKKDQVFSVEIDFDKCEFVGAPKVLFQIEGKVSGYNSGFFYFNLAESANKKSIVIIYTKNSTKIVGVKEFDENLNQVFENEIELPYDKNEVKCSDFRLDNNGDAYWIAKVFHDNSYDDKKKGLVANFHFEICCLKFGEKAISTIKVEDKDNLINKLNLYVTPNNLIVCGGTYSNGSSDVMDTDGYVGFKISPDGKVYDKIFSEFTVEVLKQYQTEKEQRSIDKTRTKGERNEITKVSLQDVHICENGDFVFIGEQKYDYERMIDLSNTLNNFSSASDVPIYLDIIISKVKSNGNVVWIKKIPKYERDLRSCWHLISNNNYYFVFVDNIHNINLPLNKRPDISFGGHDEYMSIVKISDSDGTVSTGEIFGNEDFKNYDIKKYMTSHKAPFKISENEILLGINQTKNGSGDVIVKVILD